MASIFIRTLIIYFLLSFSLKIMGKRQIGELEVSELVCTLLVSETAALPIADPDIPLLNAIIPIFLIVCLEIIISSLKNKSEELKKIIEGEPTFIIYKGELKQKALLENRISINEILAEMRIQGIGDIQEIYYAILEQNGKLSILKKGEDQNIAHTIIIDAKINENVMKKLGYSEKDIYRMLKEKDTKLEEVFLMTLDDERNINIIRKEKT